MLLSITMILITSMSIVRERERGTLEQLIVTPIDKTSLMLGKIVPFVLVGYVQMTVILLLGWLLFDVPVRGSLPLLYLLTFAFIVASLGARPLHLDHGALPGPGDAARLLLPPAQHPALGIHVPARGDAGRWPSGSGSPCR